jgi:hypothetical protein
LGDVGNSRFTIDELISSGTVATLIFRFERDHTSAKLKFDS